MKTLFHKQLYNQTKNVNGTYIIDDKQNTMYTMILTNNYFEEDKTKVLKLAIKDLEEELKKLKELDKLTDNYKDIEKY